MELDTKSTEIFDYYKILHCDRTATNEELKKSYHCLALTLHPDKTNNSWDNEKAFLLLQKAWSILRDPHTRKQYDAELSCDEHSDCLLYNVITIPDMEFDHNEQCYLYPCRCGTYYVLESGNLKQDKIIIPCDECSFSVQVNITS